MYDKFSVDRNSDNKIVKVYFDDLHEKASYQDLNKNKNFKLTVGTAFQQSVWLELLNIPAGTTISYQELANRINNPKAVRAVGQALARNPLPIILPCHRVTRKDGTLGGFIGKENAIEIKQAILNYEKELLHHSVSENV